MMSKAGTDEADASARYIEVAHEALFRSSKELLEKEVRPLVEQFLKERGLTLSPDKTRLTHIDEGFDFLGQNLRRYGCETAPRGQGTQS